MRPACTVWPGADSEGKTVKAVWFNFGRTRISSLVLQTDAGMTDSPP